MECGEKINVLGFLQRGKNDRNGIGGTLTQPLCLHIWNVAKLFYGIFYQLDLFNADFSGLVQHIGNGAVGYAGLFGNIVDGWHRIFPLLQTVFLYDNILNGQKIQAKKAKKHP